LINLNILFQHTIKKINHSLDKQLVSSSMKCMGLAWVAEAFDGLAKFLQALAYP
jgi:hypothetical protein